MIKNMKKIFEHIGAFLAVILMGSVTACNIQEINDPGDVGLGIKVFFPTKVVAGQPMTINGSGFSDAKEIVFPDGVSVTDFEIVSNEMIRLTAPSGIAAAGGKILVRTSDDEVESRLDVTLGHTVISGYSKQEGEEAEGGDLITIYGEDLEFINGIEVLDVDGNPYILEGKDLYRKGTSTVIFAVPLKNIYTGTFAAKVFTYDGQQFTMPELSYKPSSNGGHWETQKTILWENDGTPIPGWGGKFRFGLEGHDGNNECVHTFPEDVWATIKDGTFRIAVDVNESSNIRITTGWWSAAYGGAEHNCMDMVQEEEDGTKYIEINLKEEGSLYDLIDDQHLLFTGDAYTLLYIYTVEEIWVPGEEGHWEKKSFWKNDGTPIPGWGGKFRFGLEGHDGNNECIATFPADVWALIKDGTVHVSVDVNESSNIRITTGWWSAAYGGSEHNCIDMLQEEEDGTKYIELNIKEEGSLYDLIDDQHLLFTGDAYTLLEIYVMEWVEGGGEDAKPVVFWENDGSHGEVSWDGVYRFAADGHSTGEEIAVIPADAWKVIKEGTFYLEAKGSDWVQMRITTGWWSTTWTGDDICTGNERIVDNGDGTYCIEINFAGDPILDLLDDQHLLFTGGGFTPLKLYYYE